MLETLTLHDREYGSHEAAILSTGRISPASDPNVCAGTGAVLSTYRLHRPSRPQVLCGLANWVVRVNNAPLPLPISFLPSVNALLSLLSLQPGWNSYSAKQIQPRNVEAAIKFLGAALALDTPPPIVVPRVQGNIQLEWHTEQVDIEVYIDSPSSVRFFAEDATDGEVAEAPLVGHEEELKNWLKRLSSD